MIWLLGGVAFGCNCAEGRLSPAEAYARADEVVLAERVSDEEGLVTFVVKESFVRRGLKAGETFRMAYSTDLACGVSFSTVGQILLYLTEKDHVYDACDLQSAVRHGNTYWWNGSSLFYADLLGELRRLRRVPRRRFSASRAAKTPAVDP